jgi:hypothetical protein
MSKGKSLSVEKMSKACKQVLLDAQSLKSSAEAYDFGAFVEWREKCNRTS